MRCYIVDSVIGDYEKKEHVFVLPILIQIEDQTFVDNDEFEKKIVDNALENKKKITTSQPNIGNIINLFEELKGKYNEFVLIHTGSKLSGTISSSVSAAKEVDLDFVSIDSNGVSYHIEWLLEDAIKNNHMPLSELKQTLDSRAKESRALLLPGSLDRLLLSGRVSKAQSLIGELLKIKPIFFLENGELKVLKKERTIKKTLKTFKECMSKYKTNNIGMLDSGSQHLKLFQTEFSIEKYKDIHTSLLVHIDKGSIGILWN